MCVFYLDVFQWVLGLWLQQSKFFAYGSLRPQVVPAERVVTLADGLSDLITDPCCLLLVSQG